MERQACAAFFSFYDLEPPLIPVLQPELANPLYLKLVCETLRARKHKRLPKGWFGIAPVIRAFLSFKEEQFATEHSVSTGAAIVAGSLQIITSEIAKGNSSAMCWSEAQAAIEAAKPQSRGLSVLQWLVTADLLIEDGPSSDAIGAESVVRPAFERFGDFLVASAILDSAIDFNCQNFFESERFEYIFQNERSVQENPGLVSALSVLLPERVRGKELTDFFKDRNIRQAVAQIVVRSLPWRTSETFTRATQDLLSETFRTTDSYEAISSILSVSSQESKIDAFWLSEILMSLPLSKRDAFWCGYLKSSYEGNEIVRQTVDASKDTELPKVDDSIAERWCIVLLWFGAAADRRIKDSATRAATAILRYKAPLIPRLIDHFLKADDDEIRERALLAAYGSLIDSCDATVLRALSTSLLYTYHENPLDFQNALVRDHIRCIAELAAHLGCLNANLDPIASNQRNPGVFPPKLVDEAEEIEWKDSKDGGARLLVRSCVNDDFNHYSIACLSDWMSFMGKEAIGRWIARRILIDYDYGSSMCGEYDVAVTQESGGGRGKPAWAERIGKKYQWIPMYQLASRLYDAIDRKLDEWERTTGRLPLILKEERKLDPTIFVTEYPDRRPRECWWIGGNVDLQATKNLSYPEWITLKDDLPSMESLLSLKKHAGQNWIPLVSYPEWSEYHSELAYGEPYRSTWLHLEAFLVPNAQFEKTFKAITRRNFFGNWLPDGAEWLHVFAGEYPWATACNVETDDWLGLDSTIRGSSLEFIPVANKIVCEWAYDGTLPRSIYFYVPARAFFDAGHLRWDGIDGFANEHKRSVFRCPSATEGGPSTLLADYDNLLVRLKKLKRRLVWTLLGEKYVLGEKARGAPQVTYSQTAYLNHNGVVTFGDRVFFDDYDKDQGLGGLHGR